MRRRAAKTFGTEQELTLEQHPSNFPRPIGVPFPWYGLLGSDWGWGDLPVSLYVGSGKRPPLAMRFFYTA